MERSAQLEEGERGYSLTSLVTVLGGYITTQHKHQLGSDFCGGRSLGPTWIINNVQG